MKKLLMAVGIFALLPFAAPAILASMLIVGLLLHALAPLAPVLWAAVAVVVVVKVWGVAWKSPSSPLSRSRPFGPPFS